VRNTCPIKSNYSTFCMSRKVAQFLEQGIALAFRRGAGHAGGSYPVPACYTGLHREPKRCNVKNLDQIRALCYLLHCYTCYTRKHTTIGKPASAPAPWPRRVSR
jgi:hypothetical protein